LLFYVAEGRLSIKPIQSISVKSSTPATGVRTIAGYRMNGHRNTGENGLAQRAYIAMRERILRGEYAIGEVISRRKLAADLGISFLPASEAMLRLECEGLLESRPRAGTRIRIPMREDIEGHFMVREALEVQAAMMFAVCATPAQRTELAELALCVDSTDALAYLDIHESLHLKIAEITNCSALIDALRKRSAVESAWRSAMKTSTPQAQGKHEGLIAALTKRKPAVAAAAMRAHMQVELRNTLESLDPCFDTNKKHLPRYSRTQRGKPEIAGLPVA
jgi:GntR family transcriptional regulator, rspAB operon transcriptional repressor